MTMNNNNMLVIAILLLIYSSTRLHAQDPSTPQDHFHTNGGGNFEMLNDNIGVPAAQMVLIDTNEVMIIDRTDSGLSKLKFPGPCKRKDKLTGKPDCTAHAMNYDFVVKEMRPLFIDSDTHASSGAVRIDGALLHAGGSGDGANKIRLYLQCDDDKCDWLQHKAFNLTFGRSFATSQYLPDTRHIIVGGKGAPNYEFLPKDAANPDNVGYFDLPLLQETHNEPLSEENLYPFLHIMPDGNLFVFANQKSFILDYVNHKVVRTFPDIPGEPRNFPASGSSAMLPLILPKHKNGTFPVEVMICGGAARGNALKAIKGIFLPASKTCGRLVVTDKHPEWKMEDMPMPRVMGDLINLPTGDMLLINGAQKGTAGYDSAEEPALNPLLYKPNEPPKQRFRVMNPSPVARMYRSTAVLLTDGRVMVGGSNPHEKPQWEGKYPTEVKLEALSPEYLAKQYATRRPRSLVVDQYRYLTYGKPITMTFQIRLFEKDKGPIKVMLYFPPFATHSNQMSQRMMELPVQSVKGPSKDGMFTLVARAPDNVNIAQRGWHTIYVVHGGLPSNGRWVKLGQDMAFHPKGNQDW